MTASDARRAEARESGFFTKHLDEVDPDVCGAIEDEYDRQQHEIELIASENIVSQAVLEAAGTLLTNKYAEGYPGRRYYGGCQYVDVVEQLAIDRAKRLFNCAFVNVQPHSGSQANQSVLLALTKPGDTVIGMSLASGGHLTHGAPPNLSGKWFNAIQYGVRKDDHRIDYDEVERLAGHLTALLRAAVAAPTTPTGRRGRHRIRACPRRNTRRCRPSPARTSPPCPRSARRRDTRGRGRRPCRCPSPAGRCQ